MHQSCVAFGANAKNQDADATEAVCPRSSGGGQGAAHGGRKVVYCTWNELCYGREEISKLEEARLQSGIWDLEYNC
jgi:hypothetical protein